MVVFCSPPYALYQDEREKMVQLVSYFYDRCPHGSMLVVEADDRFEMDQLPDADKWDVREYPPAVVGIYRVRNELPPHGE